jgi:hypothetical protein
VFEEHPTGVAALDRINAIIWVAQLRTGIP